MRTGSVALVSGPRHRPRDERSAAGRVSLFVHLARYYQVVTPPVPKAVWCHRCGQQHVVCRWCGAVLVYNPSRRVYEDHDTLVKHSCQADLEGLDMMECFCGAAVLRRPDGAKFEPLKNGYLRHHYCPGEYEAMFDPVQVPAEPDEPAPPAEKPAATAGERPAETQWGAAGRAPEAEQKGRRRWRGGVEV